MGNMVYRKKLLRLRLLRLFTFRQQRWMIRTAGNEICCIAETLCIHKLSRTVFKALLSARMKIVGVNYCRIARKFVPLQPSMRIRGNDAVGQTDQLPQTVFSTLADTAFVGQYKPTHGKHKIRLTMRKTASDTEENRRLQIRSKIQEFS